MKGSVITSIVLHGLLLVYLLVSFGSPEPFQVTASEALPIELVPIDELTQLQEGDKEAPKKEEAAKAKTKREDKVENAENSGDNEFDLKSVPKPVEKPDNVQKAATLQKSENDAAQKDTKPVDVEDLIKEDTAVEPSTEVAKAEPQVEVKPEPRPEPEAKEEKPVEEAKEEPLPENVPVPMTRPKVEPKKVEEKKEEKKETKVAEAKPEKSKNAKKDQKNRKAAKSTTSKEADVQGEEMNELLSKVEQEIGGAKRSKNEKAFGANTSTGGEKMSQTELDALKGLIEGNWTVMPGQVTSNDIVITVKFELDENGELVGRPEVTGTGGDDGARRALEGGAVRAVMKTAPFDKLPKDKYETWRVVTLNFYPGEMM
jgi:TolA protein